MATSGNFSTSNQYIVFWIEAIQNSQNISANTSNVTVKVWARRTNTGYTTYGQNGYVNCNINGTAYSTSGAITLPSTGASVNIYNYTLNIGHNSDGTKTLPITASFGISDIGLTSSTGSWSMALTTIPRTSSISSFANFTVGSTATVNIARASDSFTHDVEFKIGSYSLGTYTGQATSCTLSTTDSAKIYSQIPNSTSAAITVIVTTKSGSTIIGSTSATATASIATTIIPTLTSVTASGVNTITGTFIKGITPITFTINGASGINGSTISSYNINFNNSNYTGSPTTTEVINTSGTLTATATVTDSRGRTSASKTVNVSVLDYTTPTITTFTVARTSLVDGQADSVNVNMVASVKSLINSTEKNLLTYKVYSKLRTSSTWVQLGDTATSGISLNLTLPFSGYAETSAYDFKLEISDKFNTVTSTVVLATAQVTLSLGKTGVGVGKIWEQGAIDIQGDIYQNGVAATATAGVANSIVKRDASGWIYNSWFKSTRGDESSAAASYLYDAGDGYMRKKSLANARAEIVTAMFTQLLSDSGYSKLPNGLILQWGQYYIPNGVTGPAWRRQVITLPIAFPTTILVTNVSYNGANVETDNAGQSCSRIINKSQFECSVVTSSSAYGVGVAWFVIGY